MAETFESEPEGEGDMDLFVNAELDRGERISCSPVRMEGFRACLSTKWSIISRTREGKGGGEGKRKSC